MSIKNISKTKNSKAKNAFLGLALFSSTLGIATTSNVIFNQASAAETNETTNNDDSEKMTGSISVKAVDASDKVIDSLSGQYVIESQTATTATFNGTTTKDKKTVATTVPVTPSGEKPEMDLSKLLPNLNTDGYTLANGDGNIETIQDANGNFTVTIHYAESGATGTSNDVSGTGTSETTADQTNNATHTDPKPTDKTDNGTSTPTNNTTDKGTPSNNDVDVVVKNDNKVPMNVIPDYTATYGKVVSTNVASDGSSTRVNYADGHYTVTMETDNGSGKFETKIFDKNDRQVGNSIFTDKDGNVITSDGSKAGSSSDNTDAKDSATKESNVSGNTSSKTSNDKTPSKNTSSMQDLGTSGTGTFDGTSLAGTSANKTNNDSNLAIAGALLISGIELATKFKKTI